MREWRNVLYKAPWRCVGKLRELAETQSASNSLWIWIQSHFKATSSQNKQLCSFATYLHFMPILDPSLLFWPQLSIKSQLPAFHIPQSGGRKLQFSSPTLFNSLENRNTSWRSGCIKSIYRLNLLQFLAAAAIPQNLARVFACTDGQWALTGQAIREAPDLPGGVHPTATKASDLLSSACAYDWCTCLWLCNLVQFSPS